VADAVLLFPAQERWTLPDGRLTPLALRSLAGLVSVLGGGQGILPNQLTITLSDGSADQPALSFKADTNTGLYRSAANTLAISAGGTAVAQFTPDGLALAGVLPDSFLYADNERTIASTAAAQSGQLLIGRTGEAPRLGRLVGTPDQVVVAYDNDAADLVLSLPQSLGPGNHPTFDGVTLTGSLLLDGDDLRLYGPWDLLATSPYFQNTDVAADTFVGLLPGADSGTASAWAALADPTYTDSPYVTVGITGGDASAVNTAAMGVGVTLPLDLQVDGVTQVRLATNGHLLINTTTDDGTHDLQVGGSAALTGNLAFTGTNQRILADWSLSATSPYFQNAAAAQDTLVGVLPATGGLSARLVVMSSATTTDASYGTFGVTSGTNVTINSAAQGAGTVLPFDLQINNATAVRLSTASHLLIGTITDDATHLLQVAGDQAFIGSARRLRGDMSNATRANRLALQTSTANSNTSITVLPSGTAVQSGIDLYNNATPTNAGLFTAFISSTLSTLSSTSVGSGTALPLAISIAGTEAARFTTSQNLLIGTTTDDGTNKLQIAGNLAFIGTGRRFLADFSNATVANRAMFQTSTANSNTNVGFIPNGTAGLSSVILYAQSNPTNASYGRLQANAGSAAIFLESGITGTGTQLPLAFLLGTEAGRFSTGLNLLLGTTTDSEARLTVSRNTAALAAPASGTVLHLGAADSGVARIMVDSFAQTCQVAFRRANTTAAAPSALAADNAIGAIQGFGYDGTAYTGGVAQALILAGEAWSSTAHGTYFSWTNVANTTTTLREVMRLAGSGNLLIGATTDVGPALLVNRNTAAPQTPPSDTLFMIANSDGNSPRLVLDAYANLANITIRRANTTAAAPSQVVSGNELGRLSWSGYHSGSAYSGAQAALIGVAGENWTSSARGAYLTLSVTPAGSTTLTEGVRLNTTGNLLINTTTDDGTSKLQVAGNLNFPGNGRRITGDMSSGIGSIANRLIFQTSTTNVGTALTVAPNGTATACSIQLYGSSDVENAPRGILQVNPGAGAVQVITSPVGTGTLLPIDMVVTSTTVLRAATTGNILIGTTTETAGAEKLQVNGSLSISSATMIRTYTAFTNGAAGNTGTLTNAPAAGNPTKWIPINDAGTTRYIPAW